MTQDGYWPTTPDSPTLDTPSNCLHQGPLGFSDFVILVPRTFDQSATTRPAQVNLYRVHNTAQTNYDFLFMTMLEQVIFVYTYIKNKSNFKIFPSLYVILERFSSQVGTRLPYAEKTKEIVNLIIMTLDIGLLKEKVNVLF